jgi:hypothetical protein
MGESKNDDGEELHIEGYTVRKGSWTKPIREWLGWE